MNTSEVTGEMLQLGTNCSAQCKCTVVRPPRHVFTVKSHFFKWLRNYSFFESLIPFHTFSGRNGLKRVSLQGFLLCHFPYESLMFSFFSEPTNLMETHFSICCVNPTMAAAVHSWHIVAWRIRKSFPALVGRELYLYPGCHRCIVKHFNPYRICLVSCPLLTGAVVLRSAWEMYRASVISCPNKRL